LLCLGVWLGIAQWIVLRRHVSRAGWWVLASFGANVLALVAGSIPARVALAQATAGSGPVTPSEAGAFFGTFSAPRLPLAALDGVIYGVITGVALVWLLRQPDKEQPSLPQDVA